MKITDIPATGEVWAACSCGQPVLVVDRYVTDRPPIPPVTVIEFYSDEGGDPDTRLTECPRCDAWLDLEEITMNDPKSMYAALVQAAEQSKAKRDELASVILRAYDAGWETGDIYEALNEGGWHLSFATIEALAQKAVTA